jgi:Mg2+/Co2+ transporter CorC
MPSSGPQKHVIEAFHKFNQKVAEARALHDQQDRVDGILAAADVLLAEMITPTQFAGLSLTVRPALLSPGVGKC